MKNKMCRVLMALSLCLTLVLICSPTAYAARNPIENIVANMYTGKMADKFYEVYVFFRSKVAIPLIILSFVSCGFQVLGSAMFDGRERDPIGAAMKQFVHSVVALGALMVLPQVLGWAIGIFEATAWKPGCIFLPFSMLWGGGPC